MRKRLTIVEQAQQVLNNRPTKKGRPKKWENFTQQEKAVALGYDIVQSILASIYVAQTQYYIQDDAIKDAAMKKTGVYDSWNDKVRNQGVQELLTEGLVANCHVCALGACYLSVVRFDNKDTVRDISWKSLNGVYGAGEEVGEGRQRLIDTLGYQMVDMLESAFERKSFNSIALKKRTAEYKAAIKKAIAFGKEYKQEAGIDKQEAETNRMLAIWMNVIKNNGVFKP